jgi:hypothetical protein
MGIKKLFLLFLIFFIPLHAYTQTGIFFQAIARDNTSNPAKDRKLYVQSNIIQSTPMGTVVLTEEHQTYSDAFGIFSIVVGNGTRVGGTVKGISNIDWAKGPYYLNIKIVITPVGVGAGWDYTKEWVDLGSTIFGTVPFALYSANTARIDDKLNYTDTSKMLSVYAKAQVIETLSTNIDTKLAIKDTAAMLEPYSKKSYTDAALLTKMNNFDTSIYAKQVSVNAALLTKMNNFDTSIYAKQVSVNAALLKKMNNFDTSIYAKQINVNAALLTKMNNFDTSIYAKQVSVNAALLTKMNNFDTSIYAKQVSVNNALLTKMNNFDTSIYAKQVTVNDALSKKLNNVDSINYTKKTYTDSALLTKLSSTGNAVTATTATKLITARNINGVAFDGTKDITITSTADAGTLIGVTLNSTVTGSSLTSVGTIASLNTGSITNSGKLIVGASSAASASAVLEANSTTKGFLPPRMTKAQRDAVVSPATGLMIWCTDNFGGEIEVYNGSIWVNMNGRISNSTLSIGDYYQGGKVAYILQSGDYGYDATTQHGLIAATSDQSTGIMWFRVPDWFSGPPVINTGAASTQIGTGFINTNLIITKQGAPSTSYAAGLARAYTGGGYTDWYLPSKDELNKLYTNRVAIGFFTIGDDGASYWSSTDASIYPYKQAWYQSFNNGGQYTTFKDLPFKVRAIRSF